MCFGGPACGIATIVIFFVSVGITFPALYLWGIKLGIIELKGKKHKLHGLFEIIFFSSLLILTAYFLIKIVTSIFLTGF